jgi:hypothetical protein
MSEDDEEHPVGVTWQERRWNEIRGWIIAVVVVWFINFVASPPNTFQYPLQNRHMVCIGLQPAIGGCVSF